MIKDLVRWLRLIMAPIFLLVGATIALGQEVQPLKPADRSSPRAAIRTFLDNSDAVANFLIKDYLPSPSRSGYDHLLSIVGRAQQGLDLSEVPPATRQQAGRSGVFALYEILNRIPLPPFDQIPDVDEIKKSGGPDAQRWVIPNTEIALVRAKSGPRSGEFVFSADTVARLGEFYERVRGLPYLRLVPLKDLPDVIFNGGGWMVPYSWTQAVPAALRVPVAGQSAWKWIGLALILGMLGLFLKIAHRVSRLVPAHQPFWRAVVRLVMPVSLFLSMPVLEHLGLEQLAFIGPVASAIEVAASAVMFVAGAWIALRFASVVAEAIIASPGIVLESLGARFIRIGGYLLGIIAATTLLLMGAEYLGVSVYGIVAGLGVGGVAFALAAQPTIENLIAGMSLLADKAVRIGDLCKYGNALGTVEAVGVRSTQFRGADRTLTNIPNAVLAKMEIVSLTRRDQMLFQTVLGLRCETTPEQLRLVLARLRDAVAAQPLVSSDSVRIRLVGLGESSLDVEVFGYVVTTDWAEFLAAREDILLSMMDVVEGAGTALALPSRTIYFGGDRGVDESKSKAAGADVHERVGQTNFMVTPTVSDRVAQ
jgi:MscS family membrane protein